MLDTSLLTVAHRIVPALQRRDWNALRRDCAPTIAFVQYRRAYLQEYPQRLRQELFGGGLFGQSVEVDSSLMAVRSALVATAKSLGSGDSLLFRNFCALIQHNHFGEPNDVDQIEVGANIADEDEARFLFGPAISGRVASNLEWRVQMESVHGKWKVRSLVVAFH